MENRIEIKSETSNRLYVVAQNKKTNNWGCSCPGWIIHRKCKHLFALKNIINLIEIEFNNTKEIQWKVGMKLVLVVVKIYQVY